MSGFSQLMMRNKGSGSNILYAPSLDGTEQITTMSGQTSPVITNNTFSGGSGFLSDGWNNSGLWKLTFEAKSSQSNSNCGAGIFLPTMTTRDQNCAKVTSACYVSIYANSSTVVANDSYFYNYSYRMYNWLPITIEKTSNTTIEISIGTGQKTYTWSVLSSTSKMCIGVDTWSSNACSIRNILVVSV